MATQDWFTSYVFRADPGTGGGDVHNVNIEIYTQTRKIQANLWFILVPTFTNKWTVTISIDDTDHSNASPVILLDDGPPYIGSGDGSDGPYQRLADAGHYHVPGEFLQGIHTVEFYELAGRFAIRFDGVYYDTSVAQLAPRTSPPHFVYTTTEDGWNHGPSCFPIFTGGCESRGNPVKPQSSIIVAYGDGGPDPLLGNQTGDFVDITPLAFDPSGLFWRDFIRTFEL